MLTSSILLMLVTKQLNPCFFILMIVNSEPYNVFTADEIAGGFIKGLLHFPAIAQGNNLESRIQLKVR